MFKDEHGESQFLGCVDINFVSVVPILNKVSKFDIINTKTMVWLECGKYNVNYPEHDIRFDCGGDTYERAIVKLAKLVKKYGDKGEVL